MPEKLLETIRNLGRPRIVVVGDFMLDCYVYGDALRISPEAPVPVLKVTQTEYSCGGAGSVAVDLAALGSRAFCIGLVGDDRNGEILREKLRLAGVELGGLLTVEDRPTTSKQRVVGLAQHRHRQQLMRIDEESSQPITQQQRATLLETYRRELASAKLVCLQDYNKGLLSAGLCREMIGLARKAEKKVLVDPCLSSDYSKYRGATLITPNRREAAAAVGGVLENEQDCARAAERLYDGLGLEAVVITLDREGAYLQTASEHAMVPTRPRSVYDVTGAGDMVLAMLAVALAAGDDYVTAVRLANIAGGIEVEKFGAAAVSVEEIANEIVHEHRQANCKVRSVDSLAGQLERCRNDKQTVVFTNGCFDVLHRGHIEFLRFCKGQGDLLVVGLNSDGSVKMIKGQGRPINNASDRAAVLAGLESVDYVTFFEQPDPLELIKKLRPDVLVKGQDWAERGVVGREFVQSYGGRVVLAPLVEGKSSTATINKIRFHKEAAE